MLFIKKNLSCNKNTFYSLLIILGLFTSQVFPHFPVKYGSQGRWIPHITSMFLLIPSILFVPRHLPIKTALYLLILCAVSVIYVISQTILTGVEFNSSDMAAIIRFLSCIFIFFSGYQFNKVYGFYKTFKLFSLIIISVTIYNYLLALDFYLNGLTNIQQLYIHKESNFRFSGTYWYPYNFTLFIFLSITSTIYLQIRANTIVKYLLFTSVVLSTFLLFMGGSRSSLLALAVITLYLLLLLFFLFSKKKITYKILGLVTILVIIAMILLIHYGEVLPQIGRLLFFQHAGKHRDAQIYQAFGMLLSNWYGILFGLGSVAVDNLYVENGMNFIFRYGIFGTVFIMLPIVINSAFRSLHLLYRIRNNNLIVHISEFSFIIIIHLNIVFSFFMLTATNAHAHFRYVFVLFFMLGIFNSYADNGNIQLTSKNSLED